MFFSFEIHINLQNSKIDDTTLFTNNIDFCCIIIIALNGNISLYKVKSWLWRNLYHRFQLWSDWSIALLKLRLCNSVEPQWFWVGSSLLGSKWYKAGFKGLWVNTPQPKGLTGWQLSILCVSIESWSIHGWSIIHTPMNSIRLPVIGHNLFYKKKPIKTVISVKVM